MNNLLNFFRISSGDYINLNMISSVKFIEDETSIKVIFFGINGNDIKAKMYMKNNKEHIENFNNLLKEINGNSDDLYEIIDFEYDGIIFKKEGNRFYSYDNDVKTELSREAFYMYMNLLKNLGE